MSNQEITGNSSFEGEAVMPENSSSSEEVTTDSTLYSSVTSDSSSEEEKTPEPPIIASIGRATQTEEPPFCGICYTDLTLDNNVTTDCGHHFCNKCFFRWIEVNATCPSCRAPIDSKTNLTEQQLNLEYTEVYTEYTRQLKNYCRQMEKNKDARMEWMEIKEKANEQMKRQIRLREQMLETEGYNEGFMAAAFEFFHGTDRKYTSRILEINKGQRGFMRGFMAGASQESRRLDRMAKEYKRYKNRKIKTRTRKVQKTLWDCGVYEKEDKDPFRNVTVGLSDDEEEAVDDNEELAEDMERMVDEISGMVAEMVV
tara:strand:+ start:134 stop:1072 length:939 start_codon:yes stop_codon:yes gene_type:complete